MTESESKYLKHKILIGKNNRKFNKTKKIISCKINILKVSNNVKYKNNFIKT